MICEKCGAEMKEIQSPFSSGMECPICGWGWVTTNMDAASEDDTNYEIWLTPGNVQTKETIKALADAVGINFLQAKKLLSSSESVMIYRAKNEAVAAMSKAKRVQAVATLLKQAGLQFSINPDFPYEV